MLKLFDHQQTALKFAGKTGVRCALFHDVGTGKTRTTLEIFKGLKQLYPSLTMNVLCPITLIEKAWGDDIKKFTNFRYQSMRKKKIYEADIYIANYEWFLRNDFPVKAGLLVLDESSKIKTHNTKITKKILQYKDLYKYRMILSATPAPNSELEYWSQINFLNDELLPTSYYAYRNKYFYMARGNQTIVQNNIDRQTMSTMLRQGFKYKIIPKYRDSLFNAINSIAHYADKDKCLDLPDRTDEVVEIDMTPEQTKIYKEMKIDCITEIEKENIVAQVALTKLMKLRQITSGFAITPEHKVVCMKANPKMKELQRVLSEIGDKQVIIWGNFVHEIQTIIEILGEDNCAWLYGGTKNKDEQIDDFKEGRKQYLIANPKSASHGLTFVNCAYQVFYSLDYSYEYYHQGKGRTHRAGQTKNCVYIHLLMKGTIDFQILDVLHRKLSSQDLLRRFLDDRNTA